MKHHRSVLQVIPAVVATVQLDLNLTLASAVHACFFDSFRVFFVKSRVFITTAREIAVHNTLRATCKSHHTSMQNTCVISKTMARRKSNLKMGRIFMRTHLPLCSD